MITQLSLENFKRFRELALELRGLTVLTGLNGAGKSTVIQALLLARQAAEADHRKVVALNDIHGLALGEAWDVLHPAAHSQEIGVELRLGSQVSSFRFDVPDDRSLNLPIRRRPDVVPDMLTATGGQFSYLNAERLGPRDQLAVTAEDVEWLGVGERGQFTAQVLAAHQTQPISERMLHPSTETHGVTTLRTQVERWASDIIRPIEITAEWLPGVSATSIRFQEAVHEGEVRGEPIRPGNTGFGLSYALPIIVGALRMRSGGLFIVENPEAHLHPAGQSRIGRFLGMLAGNNVQVVIETHSDHVLNGLRAAVAEGGAVSHDDTVFHFFGNSTSSNIETIDVNERGALSHWPEGFFDQLEHDLGRIARASRRRR